MAQIQVKVNPTIMKNKASEIQQIINSIKRDYEGIKNTANATNGYWLGDASNTFRNYVKGIDSDMQSVLKRLGEHPDDLLKMAGFYEENEKAVTEYASSLPTDIIK